MAPHPENRRIPHAITSPVGTRFQFRTTGARSLEVLGITMPPWPNTADEARVVAGKWRPTVS
jgi:mannose-6-phosphate isomerase-like protein (cupin superfamily)